MRHSLEHTWPLHSDSWVVMSAGTQARVGQQMHQFSTQVLNDAGIHSNGFVGQALTSTLLRQADLVLTADRAQRATAVQLLPASLRYTFTVRQFARMTDRIEPFQPFEATDLADAGEILLNQALLTRSKLQPVTPADDALTDPMGGPLAGFQTFARDSQKLVDSILRPIRLTLN